MDRTLEFVWGQHRSWAATARTLKNQITRNGVIVLGLTLAGTAVGTLAPTFTGDGNSTPAKVLGLVAAALLGVATYLTSQLLGDTDRQNWVKARAAAEGLKSESYKYAAGAVPYDGVDAPQRLAAKTTEAQALMPSVIAESVSDADRVKGIPTPPWTLDDYLEKRFDDQVRFYTSAVPKHKSAVKTAKNLSIGLGLIAVVLSAAGSTIGQQWPAALLGVVTTAAAAIGAWFQGGHHQQLAMTYQGTLVKLGLLRSRLPAGATRDVQFVLDAEAIFEEEHAAWLGEWQTPSVATPVAAPVDVAPVVPSPQP
jgi:hypothetical protein